MVAARRTGADLEERLADLDSGVVFEARSPGEGWQGVRDELAEAFELTRQALTEGESVVYVVEMDDLLGRRGQERAMVAAGLLSAARTAALEGRKAGLTVNVLAVEEDTPGELVARWCRLLLQPDGPTGELVRLGAGHLGKALP